MIQQIETGTVNRISQNSIDEFGIYCGMRGLGDEIINWNQTSSEIFNFVRAICKPGSQATSYINGKQIKINKVRYIPQMHVYKNTPG